MEVEDITDIDDSLYSRQRYVLGDHAMHKMANSDVLIMGFGGLGVEIAKNVTLAGVKSCTVQDDKLCTLSDLSTHFFITEADVHAGRSRVEAGISQLSELNPHVDVYGITESVRDDDKDWSYLLKYTCVVCTDQDFNIQVKINNFCRSREDSITFVSGDVIGLFAYGFCDFGENFTVYDKNGEEPLEVFICNITNDNPAVVTVSEDRPHGLETGDRLVFRELKGLEALNDQERVITVLTPYQFSIPDVAQYQQKYAAGGIASECKVPQTIKFRSLKDELTSPSLTFADLAKLDAPSWMHVLIQAHYNLQSRSRMSATIEEFMNELNNVKSSTLQIDESMIQAFYITRVGCFAPLCTVFGGFLAQEVIKAISGKFTPLNQWCHLDAVEVLDTSNLNKLDTAPRGDRYDMLRHCIGHQVCQQLGSVNLFMVGCGAIGCEMMKLYALLGISTSGTMTITDHDLIEKSNLNRQFLFRPRHVQQSKSSTAAASALKMNPELNIKAQELKVSPATENREHTDDFLKEQTIIVNALDNVEARKYMDQRCVTVGRPLLESGTTGAKGHTQVVVPHITESYSSQTDPIDEDVPFCSLKSFPSTLNHCIIWARNKFNSSFTEKPQAFNKFMKENKTPENALQNVMSGLALSRDAWIMVRQLRTRPTTFAECVKFARLKFEKYFNHKAKALLHAYPLDHKRDDGNDFWQLPRRPPTPLQFSSNCLVHIDFIKSTAQLFAKTFGVVYSSSDLSYEFITSTLAKYDIPDFIPSNKHIEADDEKPDNVTPPRNLNEADVIKLIQMRIQHPSAQMYFSETEPLDFEKDDDSNGHIDYIASAANLRAEMYGISQSDRFTIKRIAGKIIPAIATTTATVAGLVIIELFKILRNAPLEAYKNCFLSLALPALVLSEPGAAVRTEICEGLSFTLWDKLEVHGSPELTVQEFMDKAKEILPLDADMIVQGSRIIFSALMPTHRKRVSQRIKALLSLPDDVDYVDRRSYVDLVVCFSGLSDDVALHVPPIRYFL